MARCLVPKTSSLFSSVFSATLARTDPIACLKAFAAISTSVDHLLHNKAIGTRTKLNLLEMDPSAAGAPSLFRGPAGEVAALPFKTRNALINHILEIPIISDELAAKLKSVDFSIIVDAFHKKKKDVGIGIYIVEEESKHWIAGGYFKIDNSKNRIVDNNVAKLLCYVFSSNVIMKVGKMRVKIYTDSRHGTNHVNRADDCNVIYTELVSDIRDVLNRTEAVLERVEQDFILLADDFAKSGCYGCYWSENLANFDVESELLTEVYDAWRNEYHNCKRREDESILRSKRQLAKKLVRRYFSEPGTPLEWPITQVTKPDDIATHIFIKDDGPKRSLLYIETADCPGLLLGIIKVIAGINIDVEPTEIDTEGLIAKYKFHMSYEGAALIASFSQVLTNCLRCYLRRPETDEDSY